MWYTKYLSTFEKNIDTIPDTLFEQIKLGLEKIQSKNPIVSIVIIGLNEESHLVSLLWSLSEMKCSYPFEILLVDNNSTDRSKEIYERCGVTYYVQEKRSHGWARTLGLENAKGKYIIGMDADTIYPPKYVEILTRNLEKPGVVAVNSLYSFVPNNENPRWFLYFYEFLRDIHIYIQHFSRPERCVRGMVFAYNAELARKIGFRTNIKRGEDGSMAYQLKEYGKIKFIRDRKARPVTCHNTISKDGSIYNALWVRIKKHFSTLNLYFTIKTDFKDSDENLIK